MGDAAAYAYVSMRDAIADAGLPDDQVHAPRTGVIAGSGGGSAQWQIETGDLLREKGVRRVGPVHGAAHDVLDRVGHRWPPRSASAA